MQRLDIVVQGPVPSWANTATVDCAPFLPPAQRHAWLEQRITRPVFPTRPCQVAIWLYKDCESGRPMLQAMAYAGVRIHVTGEFDDSALVMIQATGDGATQSSQTVTISLPSTLTRATPVAIVAHSLVLRVCQLPFSDPSHLHCSAHNGASLFLGTEPLTMEGLDIVAAGPGPSGVHIESHPLGASRVTNCSVRADEMCVVVGSGIFVAGTLDATAISSHAVVSLPARRVAGSPRTQPALVPPRPVDPDTTCVVCFDHSAQCTLPNCGHCVLCVRCVTRLHRMAFRCPICRYSATYATAPLAVFDHLKVSA